MWPQFLFLALLVCAGACSAHWLWVSRPPHLLRRVIVNTTDPNVSFHAVLWKARGQWLTLRDAVLLTPEKPSGQKVDGEVVLERSRVTFTQVL